MQLAELIDGGRDVLILLDHLEPYDKEYVACITVCEEFLQLICIVLRQCDLKGGCSPYLYGKGVALQKQIQRCRRFLLENQEYWEK